MGEEFCECGVGRPGHPTSRPPGRASSVFTQPGEIFEPGPEVFFDVSPSFLALTLGRSVSARTLLTMGHLLLLWTTYSATGPYETENGLPSFGSLSAL